MPRISWEGTVGLLLEIGVGILDHLHVKEPLIMWGLFVLGLILLSDAVLRSDWASKSAERKVRIRNRILGMVPVVLGALIFGGLIHSKKTELILAPGTAVESENHEQLTVMGPIDGFVKSWTVKPPSDAHVELHHLDILEKYSSHFHLMLVSRIDDNKVDEMEDTHIEKSNLFSVTGPEMTIEMTLSQGLMKRAYPSKNVNFSLVALPQNTKPEQILKLSDVSKHGGAIMSRNGFPLIVKKSPPH